MTTITTTTTACAATRPDAAEAGLRTVIRADAALCLASGALLVGAAGPLTDLAGLETATPAVLPGVFLLVLGAGLALLARAGRKLLVALTPWSAFGDLAWSTGSLALAGAADLTGPGRALVAVQALVVAAMGYLKRRALCPVRG